jgi:glc operon protein GlcG
MKFQRTNLQNLIVPAAVLTALATTAVAQAPEPVQPAQTAALKTIQAIRMIEGTRKYASDNNLTLSIVVLDTAGHFLAGVRMDGAPFVTSEIARGKAFAVVAAGGVSGEDLAKRFVENPQVWGNVSSLGWGAPMLPARGAYPVYLNGTLVAAIGASGSPSEQDENAIKAGITGIGASIKP